MKHLEKFRKLKNQDELNHEIARLKEDVQKNLMELACLENMVFASDNNDSSSHNSQTSNIDQRNLPRPNSIQHSQGCGLPNLSSYENQLDEIEKYVIPHPSHSPTSEVVPAYDFQSSKLPV
eukprot:CAMPEP_0174818256 /NCGR_PEP_ID=MMETSP1107-20130205/909_1 /TAXON_ID=36770 /ORGANISM="Paraphysomonas vestita, Strain GFlagA" /LENGTH=120 /DNA_ID=CAMNT_0016029869 /DNA_START=266 /DNA_END=628 /DNA_ORIENTATION=+